MQGQRQIREQAHVALINRIGGRHRESVGHQTVVVRLIEQITPKQLPCSGFALDFFYEMLLFRFVELARIRKMHFVAMEWEERYAGAEHENQNDHHQQPTRFGPIRSATNQQPDNKVNNCACDQACLKPESRKQNKSRKQRTNRRAGSVEQRRNPDTVHPAPHVLLNARRDCRKQNSRQERDWEH